jgi:hypothetical protein
VGEFSDQPDVMAFKEGHTVLSKGDVWMVIGVRDLAVGHPDDRLISPSLVKRPAQRESIDTITHIARRTSRRHSTSLSENPDVRRTAAVAGSVTITNDKRTGGLTK